MQRLKGSGGDGGSWSMFRNAIVRKPGRNFSEGLTTAGLGMPLLDRALAEHGRYCEALQDCGLILSTLEADERHPDSTFIEDTAILTDRVAVLARPGAPSREGEVFGVREVLARFYPSCRAIAAPGTLDGGDVCQAGDHFFIGISRRTNEAGARELASLLAEHGHTSAFVDIRGLPEILHLKSALAWLGDGRLVMSGALTGHEAFQGYDVVPVEAEESYAANCVRVNDHVLLAAGYPRFEKRLREVGYSVVVLEISEFRKMDGGLSCLSLRF